MSDEGWAYIGRTTQPEEHWPIVGTVICATADKPRFAKDNAVVVGQWIRDQLVIERVPSSWVRKHFGTAEPYIPGAAETGET